MDFIIDIARGVLGMAVLLGIAYGLSANRKGIDWKLVGGGLLIQIILAFLILKMPFIRDVFDAIAGVFVRILQFTEAGSKFMFGGLITDLEGFGYIFAFQVLPTIVFFSAFSAILYYLGILQKIIYGFAWLMSRTMRLSGAESLAAAANVFIGQTEAPFVVKPYLEKMTRSEMLCLMTGGMATIAGGVFAAYVGYLGGTDPVQQQLFATHLLTASIISAPAAIIIAKMLYPEDKPEAINQDLNVSKEKLGTNLLDAISIGTTDGLKLAVNVGVMLLVFIALIYMLNVILMETIGVWTGWNEQIAAATNKQFEGFTFTYLLGLLFAPIAWLLGVAAEDMVLVGQLLGQKTVVNEFLAYAEFGEMLKNPAIEMDSKSIIIATYALCGFSNFSSIGIQIGGIGVLAPNQRQTLSEFGIKALIGGTIACFMTGVLAGVLVTDQNIGIIKAESPTVQVDVTTAFNDQLGLSTPLQSFKNKMGKADKIEVSPDSSTQLWYYGHTSFRIADNQAVLHQIDFTDTTTTYVLNNPLLPISKQTTLADIEAAFPVAYTKEQLSGKVQIKIPLSVMNGGMFLLDFENEKLIILRYN